MTEEEAHHKEGSAKSFLRPSEIPVNCEVCGQTLSCTGSLREHKRRLHKIEPIRHKCPKCSKEYFNPDQLEQHIQKNHNKRRRNDGSIPCTMCPQTFTLQTNLHRHMVDIHKVTWPCEDCGQTFKNKRDLTQHSLALHLKEEKILLCPICGSEFLFSGYLHRHMHQFHSDSPESNLYEPCSTRFHRLENVSCHICGKTFRSKDTLKRHEKIHSEGGEGEKKFHCTSCDKTFPNAVKLKNHIIRGHRIEKCPLCPDRVFQSLEQMLKHAVADHGLDEETGQLKKERCDGVVIDQPDIPTPDQTDEITITHPPTSPSNSCSLCTLTFTSISDIGLHLKQIHHVQVRYKCDYCFAIFNSSSEHDQHVFLMHQVPMRLLERHICDVFGHVAETPLALEQHRQTHSTTFARCDICRFAAECPYQLIKHMKDSHSPAKPSTLCQLCGVRYPSEKFDNHNFAAARRKQLLFIEAAGQ